MRANDRKTYLANSNTNKNRNYNESSRTNSVIGSIASRNSFLAKVREEPDELNLDSGSNFDQTYGSVYADYNKNFNEKVFNYKGNNNKSSNNTPGFFAAKINNNINAPNENYTHIENLRYRDNNQYTAAKFSEKGFNYKVNADLINQAAKLESQKDKSYFEKLATEMIYKINLKALESKKHIFDSGNLANFLSNLVIKNSFDEKKQKEILDFLRNFNPDKNFVKSLPQSEIRNFNVRYSETDMAQIFRLILKSNPNLSYKDLPQLSKKNEVLQLFKKGKKPELLQFGFEDTGLKSSGTNITGCHFNLFNYDLNSKEVGDDSEHPKRGSNRRGSPDEMQAAGRESSGSQNNSLYKGQKSTANLSQNNNNYVTNKNNINYNNNAHHLNNSNFNDHNHNNHNNYNSNRINKNTLINNIKKFSSFLQKEIKSESFRNKDELKKQTLFSCKNFPSQINENNKSNTSALSNSRNDSNSNSKDLGGNNFTSNQNNNSNSKNVNNNLSNFESASKKNLNFNSNSNLNSNKNNTNHTLNNIKIAANNHEKLSIISNNSSAKKQGFKLNRLRKFDEEELFGYQRKLHENLSNIDILNKNLMNDCRHNYDFLLNNSKTNFLKESDYHNFYVKPVIEIIPLAKRFEILEKSGDIPILNSSITETQALNQCFNKFSIISQNLVLTQKDKISNERTLESTNNVGISGNYSRRFGENSNYNADRVFDKFNPGINYFNNNFSNFNQDSKARGFNASEEFRKNPFFNKQKEGNNCLDKYDYNDLFDRKNILMSARSKMQIIKQIKPNNATNNVNYTNTKTYSENKSSSALNNDKLIVNNFNDFNNINKKEEEGLHELNRNLQGPNNIYKLTENFSKIGKENFAEHKNNFLNNAKKVENNFNLVGQSPINACFGGNSIKINSILGKSENHSSVNDSYLNNPSKNINFEIDKSYFSLNTISKRNNVFKEHKSILVSEIKNNEKEKEKEEENKQTIHSKAFSFKNNYSKASPNKEQIENNPEASSNAQVNDIRSNLRDNHHILKTSQKVNVESDCQQKSELLRKNLLINPQMNTTHQVKESSTFNLIDHSKDRNNLKAESNFNASPEKKEALILPQIESNKNAKSDSNILTLFSNVKNQSDQNNIRNNALLKPASKDIKLNDDKDAAKKEKLNEITGSKLNSEAAVDAKFSKINEGNNEVVDVTNKILNIERKNNLNNEAALPSGTSSTTIFSNKNNFEVIDSNNKVNNPILNAISANQNTNSNLVIANNEASNLNNAAVELKSSLVAGNQLNAPLVSNIDNSKEGVLSYPIPQTINVTITTIGLNSEKSLVNNSNPFLQKLNANPINKIQSNNFVNNNAQVPSSINNLSTNNNNPASALSSNLFSNNDINNPLGPNNTTNTINPVGVNTNANNHNQINNNINTKNEEMMDISTVNVNNINTNGFNNNLNSTINSNNQNNPNAFFNSNLNNLSKQNMTIPINNNSFNNSLLNLSNNPISLNNGVNNNLNNFNVNNNLSFSNNATNTANNVNNPLIGLGQSYQNIQNPLIGNNNLILPIAFDNNNSLVKANNPFVNTKPSAALNSNFNAINQGINNFPNNLASNNINSNNPINTTNPFPSSNLTNNNNNNGINNTSNMFNAINSNQNMNQISSNLMPNNSIVNNNTNNNFNNNLNSNTFNKAPIDNNLNNLNNGNNNANTLFKNPFLSSGAGNQISNGSNLNSGFGSNNANAFMPKSNTGNAFIVDPNKNNKQTGSIFSNNPTNKNRSYYTKYN